MKLMIITIIAINILFTHCARASTVQDSEIQDLFWSSLTDIEIETLSQAHKAKSGDPDALLTLAIMASGTMRSRAEYNAIKHKITQFITRLTPKLSKEKNIWRKGFQLYSAMHNEFFLARPPSNTMMNTELAGYELEQSSFVRIFNTRTYNCISSSLLYLILSRYFDLTVEGVVLPSHSFVQLRAGDQLIEIETTSITGYGLRHNRAFYNDNALQWAQIRNLNPVTYDDYLNRKIVSVYELITDNMNHQHTSADKLAQTDRYRLVEIRAWLQADNAQAQLFRLYMFNNELIRLKQKKDENGLKKLIDKARPIIDRYTRIRISGKPLDPNIHSIIGFVLATGAELHLQENHHIAAIKQFEQAIKWVQTPSQKELLQKNMAIAWLNLGNQYFNQEKYSAAIKYYKLAYKDGSNGELKQTVDRNIEAAYWNQAVPYLNSGDSETAYELLHQCRIELPHLKQCQQKIEDICRLYSLAQCL